MNKSFDNSDSASPSYCETDSGKWIKTVKSIIRNLDFGEVQLSVHKGKIVEIRKIEKIRLGSEGG